MPTFGFGDNGTLGADDKNVKTDFDETMKMENALKTGNLQNQFTLNNIKNLQRYDN